MSTPVLSTSHLAKKFSGTYALNDVSIEVHRGEVVCLIGPSGGGKSTLLRCVAGMETVDAGEVRLKGNLLGVEERGERLYEQRERETARARRNVGMVFQQFNLFEHMTALDNVTAGLRIVGKQSRREANVVGERLLAEMGLADKATSKPRQLSGGQQQRVAIARALSMQPDLLLFDEPTSALDPELVDEVLEVMRRLASSGQTMLVVTHEVAFARDVADRVIMIEQGRVVDEGTVSEVLINSSRPRTREFLGLTRRGSGGEGLT